MSNTIDVITTPTAAPKLHELEPLLVAAAGTSKYLKDRGVSVIFDDGTKAPEIEAKLRFPGAVVVVLPVLMWEKIDQSGGVWSAMATVALAVMLAPRANFKESAANANVLQLCADLETAVCKYPRHPGGKFIEIHPESGKLLTNDDGLRIYEMKFLKEVVA